MRSQNFSDIKITAEYFDVEALSHMFVFTY